MTNSKLLKIESLFNDEVETLEKKYSRLFLSELRKQVKESGHIFHNHRITISCGMGSTTLMINDEFLHSIESQASRLPSIAKALQFLVDLENELLASNYYSFCYWLDGEQIS